MDHQATTPVDPRVLEEMLPYFCEQFGNAASRTHVFGWEAEEGATRGRERVAALIGARAKEIVFTSGATESNNLAIKGVLGFYRDRGNHVVTVATEHKAVLDPLKALERTGAATVTRVKPRRDGVVDPEAIRSALTDHTVLVSVMHANNEIGAVSPVGEIGRVVRASGALFHCDAAQSAGKLPIDVDAMSIDLLSISAHKVYGPKGVGALFVRAREPRVRLIPIVDGGGHERGTRSGTLNVPGVVGFGAACAIAGQEMATEGERLLGLRERLRRRLCEDLDEVYVNGSLEQRLPHNLNVSFGYVEGESLLMGLKEIALSSGSACTSTSLEPSHVLRAIGVSEELAHSSIRFGLGRYTTEEEVDYVAERVVAEVRRLRRLSPLYAARQRRAERTGSTALAQAPAKVQS
jgi:cysteine desulfurase